MSVEQDMITREDLARFILQVSEEFYSKEDWERIAINHYPDDEMEEARIELVRHVLDSPTVREEERPSRKERMVAIAAKLKV